MFKTKISPQYLLLGFPRTTHAHAHTHTHNYGKVVRFLFHSQWNRA